MKQLIILTVLTTATFALGIGQDIPKNQVPQQVIDAFTQDFSKARDVEWEKRGSNYEVEFDIRWGKDHEVRYDTDGNILYHREDIRKRDLPDEVTDRIRSDFDGYNIDDAEKITEGDNIHYELSLDSRRMEDLDVVISSTGEVISQTYDD